MTAPTTAESSEDARAEAAERRENAVVKQLGLLMRQVREAADTAEAALATLRDQLAAKDAEIAAAHEAFARYGLKDATRFTLATCIHELADRCQEQTERALAGRKEGENVR